MKLERMGWLVAAALAGSMVGMGFQAKAEKTGTVDLQQVLDQSGVLKKSQETLRNAEVTRQGVLDFVNTYRTLKPEDAVKFRDLTLKESPTPADRTELERIRASGQQEEQKYREVVTKEKPTQADVASIEEYNRRKETNTKFLQEAAQAFQEELQRRVTNLRNDNTKKAREAVQQVAKEQGYTIVFDQQVAPYAANDLTSEAVKAMGKK